MSNVLERLKSLCDPEKPPILDQVWRVKRNGAPWLMATNGHAFLVLPSDESADPAPSSIEQVLRVVEQDHARLARPMAWAPIAKFMRTDVTMVCNDCNGEGKAHCSGCNNTGRCNDCNGVGRIPRPPERVRFLGAVLDRVLFTKYATGLDADSVRVSVDGELGPITLEREGEWLLCVMPTRHDKSDEKRGYKIRATFEASP